MTYPSRTRALVEDGTADDDATTIFVRPELRDTLPDDSLRPVAMPSVAQASLPTAPSSFRSIEASRARRRGIVIAIAAGGFSLVAPLLAAVALHNAIRAPKESVAVVDVARTVAERAPTLSAALPPIEATVLFQREPPRIEAQLIEVVINSPPRAATPKPDVRGAPIVATPAPPRVASNQAFDSAALARGQLSAAF